MPLLWALIVLLVLFWALGFFIVHLGTVIHVLLVLALVALVWNLLTGSRTAV